MPDISPPDYTSAVGKLRNLTAQTEQYKDPANPSAAAAYLMSDAQLQSFYDINSQKLFAAAADILLALAANEALISKKIRTEDLSTDGPAVAAELRRMADSFKAKQKDEDEAADSLEAFEVVNYVQIPPPYPLR